MLYSLPSTQTRSCTHLVRVHLVKWCAAVTGETSFTVVCVSCLWLPQKSSVVCCGFASACHHSWLCMWSLWIIVKVVPSVSEASVDVLWSSCYPEVPGLLSYLSKTINICPLVYSLYLSTGTDLLCTLWLTVAAQFKVTPLWESLHT